MLEFGRSVGVGRADIAAVEWFHDGAWDVVAAAALTRPEAVGRIASAGTLSTGLDDPNAASEASGPETPAITTTRNLAMNGDAEAGPWATDFSTAVWPQGWGGASASFTPVTYAAGAGDPNALHSDIADPGGGGNAYFSGGPNAAHSSAEFIIDPLKFVTANLIDAGGVSLDATVDLGGYSTQDDGMTLNVYFFNANNDILQVLTLTGPTAADRGNVSKLIHAEGITYLPLGTRFIIVSLNAERVGGGSYNDGYADNVVVTLSGEGVSGGVVQVTSDHDYHHEALGYISGVQFETTHAAVTATFSADQLPPLTLVTGDAHADTLSILLGDSHTFGGHLNLTNWTEGSDKVVITGTSAADSIQDTYLTDVIHAGGGNDQIAISGGADSVFGEDGDDTIDAAAMFTSTDRINGGAGFDTLTLNGDYSTRLTLASKSLTAVEDILMIPGHSYNLRLADANVAAGKTMYLSADALLSSDTAILDGSRETDGFLVIRGGHGADTLFGGAQGDTLDGGGGADRLDGGGGADVFDYSAVGESTSSVFDAIDHFDAAVDKLDISGLGVNLHAIDTPVTSGKLVSSNFDPSLTQSIGAHQLHAHDAVLFTPSAGTAKYVGQTFLIVDVNGTAGYQADQDLVIELTHASNLADFSLSDFIL